MNVSIKKKLFFGKLRIFLKCPLCKKQILLDDEVVQKQEDKNIDCFKCQTTYHIVGIKPNQYQITGILNENEDRNR